MRVNRLVALAFVATLLGACAPAAAPPTLDQTATLDPTHQAATQTAFIATRVSGNLTLLAPKGPTRTPKPTSTPRPHIEAKFMGGSVIIDLTNLTKTSWHYVAFRDKWVGGPPGYKLVILEGDIRKGDPGTLLVKPGSFRSKDLYLEGYEDPHNGALMYDYTQDKLYVVFIVDYKERGLFFFMMCRIIGPLTCRRFRPIHSNW